MLPPSAVNPTTTGAEPERLQGREPLDVLLRVADSLDAEDISRDALALRHRVAERRFNVACLGQFKRGKSSLINALIGMTVLPTGIVPVTAVPTLVRHGDRLGAKVRLRTGNWEEIDPAELSHFVSEEHNPANRLGVEAVELAVPSAILEGGLCFVDTPGVGSVFEENSAATREFLPHVDVALVITGVDPPLTGEELLIAEAVARDADVVLLILNKADRFEQAARMEAAAFAQRILAARLARDIPAPLHVSATEAGSRDAYDWALLQATLVNLQRDSGSALVRRAHDRGVVRLARLLEAEVAVQRRALTEPVEEGQARIDRLGTALEVAARQMGELSDRVAGEGRRLASRFASRRDAFVNAAAAECAGVLDEMLAALPPRARDRATQDAREIARDALMPWLAQESRDAEAAYSASVPRLIEFVNRFLLEVRANAPEEFDRLPAELPTEMSFDVPSRYYYREIIPLARVSPLRSLLDRVQPAQRVRADIRLAARTYLVQLLEMNSTLVLNDLTERMDDSRRQLEARVRALIDAVSASARRAVERGRDTQAAGAAAVATALASLDTAATDLRALLRAVPPAG